MEIFYFQNFYVHEKWQERYNKLKNIEQALVVAYRGPWKVPFHFQNSLFVVYGNVTLRLPVILPPNDADFFSFEIF